MLFECNGLQSYALATNIYIETINKIYSVDYQQKWDPCKSPIIVTY